MDRTVVFPVSVWVGKGMGETSGKYRMWMSKGDVLMGKR